MWLLVRVFLEILEAFLDKFEVLVIRFPLCITDVTNNTFFRLVLKRLLFKKLSNITINNCKVLLKLFFKFLNFDYVIVSFSKWTVEAITGLKGSKICEPNC